MKFYNLIAVFFLLISTEVISQEVNTFKNNSDFFSLALSIGLTGNVNSQKLIFDNNTGFNYNIDVSYTPECVTGLFVNYSSSYLTGYNSYSYPYSKGRIDYTQISLGPRFYSGKKNSFIDAGLGYSNIKNDDVIGVTFGLGGKFKITDNYAVTLTGRVYAADIFNSPYVNYTLSSGFELRSNNKSKDVNKNNPQNRKFSLAVLAGTYLKNTDYPGGNSFKAEFTYELAKKTVFLLNYVYTSSGNDYSGFINTNYKQSRSEYTFGVRYYIKDDNLKLFVEGLSGAYIVSLENHNFIYGYNSTFSFAGFTIGGGVELKLVDQLSGILKTDLSNTFSDSMANNRLTGSFPGFFGGLKYNL